MAAFETKIRHQRISFSPFTGEQMNAIATVALKSIIARIKSGTDSNDSPAKELAPWYKAYKQNYAKKYGLSVVGIRDWTLSGRTLASAKVKLASEDHAVIGFIDGYLNRKITVNNLVAKQNRMSPMWGLSPKDMEAVYAEVIRQITVRSPIQIEQVA